MTKNVHYEQLGRFVVAFQNVDSTLTELLVDITNVDDEIIDILATNLDYSKRVMAADVLFARFVDVRRNTDVALKAQFHKLMSHLLKLGERRNELVHSTYTVYTSVEGVTGLMRQNSKLKGKKGVREINEEILSAEHLDKDLQCLNNVAISLEEFRQKIIHIESSFGEPHAI